MNRSVFPSTVRGSIQAPPSKSMTQRAIAAAILAKGSTTLINPSYCNDSQAAFSIARELGCDLWENKGDITVISGQRNIGSLLNCGESGLALRMFSPIAALYNTPVTISGEGSLLRRPAGMISEALQQFGVRINSNNGFLPIQLQGPLHGGNADIDGSLSSQLLTGLLMALPLAEENSEITVRNLRSRPYIDMTLELLETFGIRVNNEGFQKFIIPGKQAYKAKQYTVEGDWSNAAFLLVAGAIHGNIIVHGLRMDSRQADRVILEVLEKAGVKYILDGTSVEVITSKIRAFQFDASDCPDLFPPLAVLAAYADGISSISGVERLLHKESNRAESIGNMLKNVGIKVQVAGNEMLITGGTPKAGHVNSCNDHRIAMMAAIAAIGADGPVTIADIQCVDKSYPGFFEDLEKLGVRQAVL
ncbi:MAG: 3-phosphoshikimate 1-carboxyvinyltransferase [Bacteroidetes bacterium]|nr:3-phosphoshikimate 1-carboxyvinyltransferase [Bacteroidota bacterium]